MNLTLKSAIFFDRDGTLIMDKVYQSDPAAIEYCEGYWELMTFLRSEQGRQRFPYLFVVTNQSGIGRGMFAPQAAEDIHQKMNQDLRQRGLDPFDDWQFCPHLPEDKCSCRKPEPGMLLTLVKKWNIDVTRSVMVGDKTIDGEAGLAAGIGCNILLREGMEKNLTSIPNLHKLTEYLGLK